jgi:hypothetical protein
MRSLIPLLLASLAAAWTTPFIPTEQVRPGMRGTGRSVFASSRGIEQFEAEVIDVMRQATPRGDLILCRLSGAGLEHSGVIAGMSGSPVYVDGRLMGAVSYAFPFGKDPICGVTPAAEMLRILDLPDVGPGPGSRGTRRSTLSRLGLVPAGEGEDAPTGLPAHGLAPIRLPVAISGLTPALSGIIAPPLSECGLLPVAAAGAGAVETDTAGLVPGGAVGSSLIDGDVRMAGIGTITIREDSRLVVFGHPMVQGGSVRLPMCGGTIHEILPSVYASFKLFSPTATIGTLTQDRLAGVCGTIGTEPPMIPVTVLVRSPVTNDTDRFRVAEHDALSPLLASVGLTDVVMQTEGVLEEMDLTSEMEVTCAGAPPLRLRHRLGGPNAGAVLFAAARTELDALFSNPFRPAAVSGIRFDLKFTPGRDEARLLGASVSRSRVRPGDSIDIALRLRDHRGLESSSRLGVRIPPTAPAGELTLVVASGDSLLQAEATRAPQAYEPSSFAGLLGLMALLGNEDHLAVAGYVDAAGFASAGREMPRAPASFRQVVARSGADALTEARLFTRHFPQDRPVYGVVPLKLEVIR